MSRLRVPARLLALTTTVVLLGGVPNAAAADDHRVDIVNGGGDQPYGYVPATISIAAGDSVTFVNPADTALKAADQHPTVCRQATSTGPCPGGWPTQLPPGSSGTVVFPADGTFTYYCGKHPYMEGTVVVGSGTPPTTTAPTTTEAPPVIAPPVSEVATTVAPSTTAPSTTATPDTADAPDTAGTVETPEATTSTTIETQVKGIAISAPDDPDGGLPGVAVVVALLALFAAATGAARARTLDRR